MRVSDALNHQQAPTSLPKQSRPIERRTRGGEEPVMQHSASAIQVKINIGTNVYDHVENATRAKESVAF